MSSPPGSRAPLGAGSILALVVVVGYVGFEVNAVRRAQHRFEPLYTFDQFVSMEHASVRCGDPDAETRRRFDRNLASVVERARRDLAETHPELPPGDVQQRLEERLRARQQEVDALVEAGGCDDREVWSLLQLYGKRARLTVR